MQLLRKMVPEPESKRTFKHLIANIYLEAKIKVTPRYTPTSKLGGGTMPKGGIGLGGNNLRFWEQRFKSFWARHLYNDSEDSLIFLVAI